MHACAVSHVIHIITNCSLLHPRISCCWWCWNATSACHTTPASVVSYLLLILTCSLYII